MEKLRDNWAVSFSTKVLVPMVITMVVLLAVTVWLVNRRITGQFQSDAIRSLAHADKVFRHFAELHAANLLDRFRGLPSEPRYKAAFQVPDAQTLRDLLADLRNGQNLDVILFTTDQFELAASSKRDPLVSIAEFEVSSAPVVRHALQGEDKLATLAVGERLFTVVSIPVFGAGDHLIGALTLGQELGERTAQELHTATRCHIVLVANQQVIASTVGRPELRNQFTRLLNESEAASARHNGPRQVLLGDEHYYCLAGHLDMLAGESELGYLLLASYEQPLRALQVTQQMLQWVSALAILFGTAFVWLLVRKVTEPLRALRDSAEAVGKGDFSRRVEVASRDECGELAAVFNQMTENLQRSREQLERTVETLKTTQAQLVQSEKLSGIGEFVAGVAHELNNPLTTVMGFSELLKQNNKEPQHQRFLDLIHQSAQRCQRIVQSLLSFSRRHQPERKSSNLNELVQGAVEILQYQMRTSNIEVVTHLDPHLPPAMVDPHQLLQVFVNIVNNARQAIEAHRPSGRVIICTETRDSKARILFRDDGPGIPEQHLSRVFDPFFTTKDVGKGTGLGLSLCYGIIQEHGGTITVRSRLGEGATFIIELPVNAGPHPASAKRPEQPTPRPNHGNGNGNGHARGAGKRVLVIDDEESILQMVREVLAKQGYEVDVASDGESALRRMRHTPYDLALCDWKMPGLNGRQVYERLRRSNPALSNRMIFITGDVVSDQTQRFLREHKKVCLSKPFSLSDFDAAIGEALAEE